MTSLEEMKQKYHAYLKTAILPESYELSGESFYHVLTTDQEQSKGSFFGNGYEVSAFNEQGIATVYRADKHLYNHIDITGQLVDEWRDHKTTFQPNSKLDFNYKKTYRLGTTGVGKTQLQTLNLATVAGNLVFDEGFFDQFASELEYLIYFPVTKTVGFQFEDEEIVISDLLGNRLNVEPIYGTFVYTNTSFPTKPGLYLVKAKQDGNFEKPDYQIVSEDGVVLDHNKSLVKMENRYRKLEPTVRDECYVYRFDNGDVCDWIPVNHAVTMGKEYYTYNFRDPNGNKILEEDFRMSKDLVEFKDCVQYFSGVEKPKASLRFLSYKLEAPEKTYRLDYQPLRDYGTHVLCMNQSQLLFYDKVSQDYQVITNDLKPDDVLFIDQNKFSFLGNMYLVQPNHLVDISQLHLTDYTKISLADPLEPVLDYDTFVANYQKDPQIMKRMEQERIQREQEKLRKEHEEKQLQKQQMIEENNAKIGELLESAVRLIQLNNSLDSDLVTVQKHIPEEILFVEKEDHREFHPMFLMEGFLRYIDLSSVSFDQTKVSGINFKGTNAAIDPQTVYQKDMSNGIYDGLNFNLKSFAGVNTTNSSFQNCIMDFVEKDDLKKVARKRSL